VLARAGCNESQGYLHSRPVAAQEFELLLSQNAGVLLPRGTEDDPSLQTETLAK
jgi:hypothetical protein